jgi:hypothetical protein
MRGVLTPGALQCVYLPLQGSRHQLKTEKAQPSAQDDTQPEARMCQCEDSKEYCRRQDRSNVDSDIAESFCKQFNPWVGLGYYAVLPQNVSCKPSVVDR